MSTPFHTPQLIHLYRCTCEDLFTRLAILFREARHLQLNVAYITKNHGILKKLHEEEGNENPYSVKELWEAARPGVESDSLVWVTRTMAASLQQVRTDLWTYMEQVEAQRRWLRCVQSRPRIFWTVRKVRQFQLTQLILRAKAGQIAKRLGQFQDRMGQTMEQTNPEALHPMVRRRKEKGLIDKYLSTLTRWAFRDLGLIIRDICHCPLPYSQAMPVAIQYWEHDYTSSNERIIGDHYYTIWRDKIRSPDPNAFTGEKNMLPAFHQTVIIQMGYWMLERHALHPILGHELAHRLLMDVLGGMDSQVIEKSKTGELGELGNAILRVLEDAMPKADPRYLTLEILADLLAVSRFGHAYLYAWHLEMAGFVKFEEQHIVDEYYNLDSSDEVISDLAAESTMLEYSDKAESPIPEDFLRGICLLAWLSAMKLSPGDPMARSLGQAVHGHLLLQLQLRFERTSSWFELWASVGQELEQLLKSKKYSSLARGIARSLECTLPSAEGLSWTLGKQRLSDNLTKATRQRFLEILGDENNPDQKDLLRVIDSVTDSHKAPISALPLHGATDLCWRDEWLLQDASFHSTIGMEDYLGHTMPPCRFLHSIKKRVQNSQVIATIIEDSCMHSKRETPSPSCEEEDSSNPCLWLDIGKTRAHLDKLHNTLFTSDGKLDPQQMQDCGLAELSNIPRHADSTYFEELSGKNYLLDLLVFSDATVNSRNNVAHNLHDRQSWVEVKPMRTETLSATEAATKAAQLMTTARNKMVTFGLLGSFDRAVLLPYPGLFNANTTDQSDKKRKFLLGDPTLMVHYPYDESNNEPISLPYFDRRRLLRQVAGSQDETTWNKTSILVLISLWMPGMRTLFLNWFQQQLDSPSSSESWRNLLREQCLALFRSSGWEDFVLLLSLPEQGNDETGQHLEEGTRIAQKLADHPLVRRTYTILTHQALQHWPEKQHERFSIQFQIKTFGNIEQCLDLLKREDSIHVTAGEFDISLFYTPAGRDDAIAKRSALARLDSDKNVPHCIARMRTSLLIKPPKTRPEASIEDGGEPSGVGRDGDGQKGEEHHHRLGPEDNPQRVD